MTQPRLPRWPLLVRFASKSEELEIARCHTPAGARLLADMVESYGHEARVVDIMAGSFVLTLPLPAVVLNPNRGRKHWSRLASAKKVYTAAAFYAATDWINRTIPKPQTPFAAIEMEPTFYFVVPRDRDRDNWGATLKAYQDGIEKAGIVKNDKDVTNLPPIFEIDRDRPRVELLITPTPN